MRRKMKTALFILSALVITLFSSCSSLNNDDALSSNNETKGGLKVLLTDAPFPTERVDSVVITIDQVAIKKVDDVTTEETDESGFIVLSTESQTFDLLQLQNGTVADIADTSAIEIGTYNEIRLHIVSALVYVDANTEPFDIKIPSGTSSGLKVKIDGGVEIKGNLQAVVYIDFDVSRSFLVQGNPKDGEELKGFKFKPVIRATADDISGSIEGYVTIDDYDDLNIPDIESLVVAILDPVSGDTVSSARPAADGYYAVIGLVAGEYTVACSAEGYDDFQMSANVDPKTATTVDITLTETLAAVKGQIVTQNGETIVNLSDVTVNILNGETIVATVTTGEDGMFEIGSIPPGSYSVTSTKEGYTSPDAALIDLILGEIKDLGTITMTVPTPST